MKATTKTTTIVTLTMTTIEAEEILNAIDKGRSMIKNDCMPSESDTPELDEAITVLSRELDLEADYL